MDCSTDPETGEVDDIVTSYGELMDRPSFRGGKCEVLIGTEGNVADQYFCIYPTGVIVTGVTKCHPLVQAGEALLNRAASEEGPRIQIVLENEDDWSVADRGQKAKIPKFTDHTLCNVFIGEQKFRIHHPFDTALLNFNPRLRTHPELLIKRCHWEGHIAVLSTRQRTVRQMKRRFVEIAKYCEGRLITEDAFVT